MRGDLAGWMRDPHRATRVMGILNVTPDSFSDGGRFASPDAALAHGQEMAARGAHWIDVGAESTRPGSQRTAPAEQLRRLTPVLGELRRRVNLVLSIDTTSAAVAQAALDAGFDVVNDISAGTDDPAMLPLVGRYGVSIILMHMRGQPATMQNDPQYGDVTREVIAFLEERRAAAESAGIARERILYDPGIGFGKKSVHSLRLLRDLPKLAALGHPVVAGTSRKKFIGDITGEPAETGRPIGTAATVAWCAANGAAIVRVHEVEPMARVVKVVQTIMSSAENDEKTE